jgi:hypothetical protein
VRDGVPFLERSRETVLKDDGRRPIAPDGGFERAAADIDMPPIHQSSSSCAKGLVRRY